MKSFEDFLNEAKEVWYGPFSDKKKAAEDAVDQIGGGVEGVNFSLKKKSDGWYWSESV